MRNDKGGNKTKKQKRSRRVDIYTEIENDQLFGKITKNDGGHFMVLGTDNVLRKGKLKNIMKKGPRIGKDTFVAFSLRSFNDKDECDIIGLARPPQNVVEHLISLGATKKSNISDVQFNYDSDDNEFKNLDKIKVAMNDDDYFNTDYMNENNSEDEMEYENEEENDKIYNNINQDINFDDMDIVNTQEIKNEENDELLEEINNVNDYNKSKNKNKLKNNKVNNETKNETNSSKEKLEENNMNFDVDFDDI